MSQAVSSQDRTRATGPAAIVEEFCRSAPPAVDGAAIRRAWLAHARAYDVNEWRLPLPHWVERQYEDPGPRAWDIVKRDLAGSRADVGLCIYLHVPFCRSKCAFCDSYSFKLGSHVEETRAAYVDLLLCELALWARLEGVRDRRISTVHLGGGTPTYLGERELARLVQGCRTLLSTSPDTEWALEATAESLTPSMIATMDGIGFRRLHIGVQTLEDPARRAIGRPGCGAEVLAAVEATLAAGWVVSVDLLCGLPEQTLEAFIDGITTLIEAGVDGFSLYELLIFPQNRRWAESYGLIGRDHLRNYLEFLAGAGVLESHGYVKNVFNHWAGPRDGNTYFTFPTRGEDCLAVGTIADGVFGDYHYRHHRYARYVDDVRAGSPGLEGGLRRTAGESTVRPLVTALLSGYLAAEVGARFVSAQGVSLLERWRAHGLLEPDPRGGMRLTASGAWFAGNLVAELEASGRGDACPSGRSADPRLRRQSAPGCDGR